MSTSWLAEDAFKAFAAKRDVVAAAAESNEATTRLRAIDTLLFEVLQWDRRIVDSEKYYRDEGYADYYFGPPPRFSLILEAKRSNEYFVLPDVVHGDDPVPFSLLAKECPAAAAAMRQAVGYAASEGARFVAISNGFQWLLSLAWVHNERVEDRLVYVFESLKAIETRFRTFWDCFSPAGITSNWPATKLVGQRRKPAPAKLAALIRDYAAEDPHIASHNPLAAALSVVWETLGLLEEDPGFLSECYVKPDEVDDSLRIAKELVENRLATDELLSVSAMPAGKVVDMFSLPSPEKPILVLGRVGHGKSTFLRFLRTIEAPASLKRYIQIQINFVDQPESEEGVAGFIYTTIDAQLRERYGIDIDDNAFVRAALHGDLNRFKKSPVGATLAGTPAFREKELAFIEALRADRPQYLARVFKHLRASQQRPLAIFLDNLDRQGYEIQEAAFLRASAMARDWSSLIFVCLRPDTFYKSKDSGVLDAIAPRTLVVAAPRTQQFLRRRFEYAATIAKGEVAVEALRIKRASIGKDLAQDLPGASRVFEGCAAALSGGVRRLPALFDAVCNRNMRLLLKQMHEVLTSGHIDTRPETLAHVNGDPAPLLTDDNSLAALLYKNHKYYDPANSRFVNLFDIPHADPLMHFARLTTLHYLREQGATIDGAQFAPVDEVVRFLTGCGYTFDFALATTQYLYEKQYLEAEFLDLSFALGHRIRLTALGRFHLTDLMTRFEYFDAVVVDTPILDDKLRVEIVDALSKKDRLARARVFLRYLNRCADEIIDPTIDAYWQQVHEGLANRITDLEQPVLQYPAPS